MPTRIQNLVTKLTVRIRHAMEGDMGVGFQKKPIVKQVKPNTHCGLRLGGIRPIKGSAVEQELAKLAVG
ncbi:MAG: hypothetical protein K8F54_02050 [Altibacter sp.]|uniref:hypothetical protein n=1 Tax=Altibacter sp. TaxID=2024823 RepID=UPI001D70DD7D|nr:hypothetical protein [Altibacter sp.]MBZ0326363.1 hypothetical protein [Altibacter sp.]